MVARRGCAFSTATSRCCRRRLRALRRHRRDIPLDELKYWSVKRQEAYVDATASLVRFRETGEI